MTGRIVLRNYLYVPRICSVLGRYDKLYLSLWPAVYCSLGGLCRVFYDPHSTLDLLLYLAFYDTHSTIEFRFFWCMSRFIGDTMYSRFCGLSRTWSKIQCTVGSVVLYCAWSEAQCIVGSVVYIMICMTRGAVYPRPHLLGQEQVAGTIHI